MNALAANSSNLRIERLLTSELELVISRVPRIISCTPHPNTYPAPTPRRLRGTEDEIVAVVLYLLGSYHSAFAVLRIPALLCVGTLTIATGISAPQRVGETDGTSSGDEEIRESVLDLSRQWHADCAWICGCFIVLAGYIPAAKRSTAFGVFDTGFGIAWFGGRCDGFAVQQVLAALVVFSAVFQTAALPVFFYAGRLSRRKNSHEPFSTTFPTSGRPGNW